MYMYMYNDRMDIAVTQITDAFGGEVLSVSFNTFPFLFYLSVVLPKMFL